MNSKLTRERIEQYANDPRMCNINDEIREMARMALAAMDSEPVAWQIHTPETGVTYVETNSQSVENIRNGFGIKVEITPLYHHAQLAPVVPDEMLCNFYEVSNWPDLVRELVKHIEQLQDSAKRNVKPWEDTFPETLLPAYIERIKLADEASLAAMLQAGDFQSSLKIDHESTFIKHIKSVSEKVRAGNSPAIPDGYVMVPVEPTKEILDEFDSIIDYGAEDSVYAWHRLLAAATQLPGSEPATVPSKWISVSERMPENKPGCYKYLVFETLNNRVNHDYWNAPDKGDDAFTPFWNYYGGHVTHWMPLPAAPQEEKP